MRTRLIVLALVAGQQAGVATAQPVIEAVSLRPRVIVDGYGEVKTAPDLATISYTARGEGSTSDDAVRAMTLAEYRIETSLRAIDSSAVPRTGDVMVQSARNDECKDHGFGPPQMSTGVCAVTGYVATQSVTVRTGAVRDAGTMVGLASRAGGYTARISGFSLQDPRAAQRQATAAALADAASKAGALAEAGHVSLGAIQSINASSRAGGQQLVVYARAPAPPPPPPPVGVKLTPEQITTTANVTVAYAIGQ